MGKLTAFINGDVREKIGYFLYKLRYILYTNIDDKLCYLQADLDSIHRLPDINPFYVRDLDINNETDVSSWVNIVNAAYSIYGGELPYTLEKAKDQLVNHLFLLDTKTFFVIDGDQPIATVTAGVFKNNPHVGSIARLAVKPEYQGKGLGKFIILYGYHWLRSEGIRYGESLISSKRDRSIMVHLSCGFRPQLNMGEITWKGGEQNTNYIQRWRLNRKLDKLSAEFFEDMRNGRFANNRHRET